MHPLLFRILVGVNLSMLLVSYAMPFMQTTQLVFFQDRYTLLYSIDKMMDEGQYLLALVIFLFSVVFPIAKVGALMMLGGQEIPQQTKALWLKRISAMGKWSMLDVFVIAILIVMINSQALLAATPKPGIYLFAAAVLMSMVLTKVMEKEVKSDSPF